MNKEYITKYATKITLLVTQSPSSYCTDILHRPNALHYTQVASFGTCYFHLQYTVPGQPWRWKQIAQKCCHLHSPLHGIIVHEIGLNTAWEPPISLPVWFLHQRCAYPPTIHYYALNTHIFSTSFSQTDIFFKALFDTH